MVIIINDSNNITSNNDNNNDDTRNMINWTIEIVELKMDVYMWIEGNGAYEASSAIRTKRIQA